MFTGNLPSVYTLPGSCNYYQYVIEHDYMYAEHQLPFINRLFFLRKTFQTYYEVNF